MKINYLYRISDAGNPKVKLPIATKMYCLTNFIQEFKDNIYIFADNCKVDTVDEIKRLGITIIEISLGNSASWRFVVDYAIDNFNSDEFVYLIEDDYIHLPGALIALKEGLRIADYVTLYDHPDKYIDYRNGGPNPYISHGGELTRVLLTDNFHWKQTNSTTMTFATKVSILKEDKIIWWKYTDGKIPRDFIAFRKLTNQKLLFIRKYYREYLSSYLCFKKKKRILISPVPGLATHAETDLLMPLTFWHNKNSWEQKL